MTPESTGGSRKDKDDTSDNHSLVSSPIATEIKKSKNPQKSVFRQNGGENYFRFRFSLQIRILCS